MSSDNCDKKLLILLEYFARCIWLSFFSYMFYYINEIEQEQGEYSIRVGDVLTQNESYLSCKTIFFSFGKCFYQLAKKNEKFFFDSVKMLRFAETKIAKEKFFSRQKSINTCHIGVNDMVASK